MNFMKIVSNSIKVVVGLGLLLFLINNIGLNNIIEKIANMQLAYIFLLVLAFFANMLVGTLNLKILMVALNEKMHFFRLFNYNALSWSYGLFLPGKIGEFGILVYFLKKEGVHLSNALIISIIDKLTTFLATFIIAILGFFTFFRFDAAIIIVLIILALFLIGLFIIIGNRSRSFLKRFILKKYANHFEGFSKNLFFLFKEKKVDLFANFMLTFLKLGLLFMNLHFLFLAIGKAVPLFAVFTIFAITAIVGTAPISIGGLGVKEYVGVLLFSQYGITQVISGTVFIVFAFIKYAIGFGFILLNLAKR